MRAFLFPLLLLLALLRPAALSADDERTILSPDGQLEFRIFVGQQQGGSIWSRIAYQVWFHGNPLLTTSWMGLDIANAEPFLGENPGFMNADSKSNVPDGYNSLVAHYIQNGTLGRLLDIEIRAYDDGVAFRYNMLRSTALPDALVREEATEFNFADPAVLAHLPQQPDYDLPFSVQLGSGESAVITDAGKEARDPSYPRTYLIRTPTGMRTNLSRTKAEPGLAFDGRTPVIWPWRVILIGTDQARLAQSGTLSALNH